MCSHSKTHATHWDPSSPLHPNNILQPIRVVREIFVAHAVLFNFLFGSIDSRLFLHRTYDSSSDPNRKVQSLAHERIRTRGNIHRLSQPVELSNMGFKILPLEEQDIPQFVRIELEAFRSHPRIPMASAASNYPAQITFLIQNSHSSYGREATLKISTPSTNQRNGKACAMQITVSSKRWTRTLAR